MLMTEDRDNGPPRALEQRAMSADRRMFSPSAARNSAPILAVLKRVLTANGAVLEIGCGTGEHAVCFARAIPNLIWHPSDPDPDARASTASVIGPVVTTSPRLIERDAEGSDSDMSHAIIRGNNGRRHEVDFGDAPVRVEVYASEDTFEIFVEADAESLPEEKRRFAIVSIPRHQFSEATGTAARRASWPKESILVKPIGGS
jgi:hypothetical protein